MAIDKALEDQIKVPKQVIPGEEVPIETLESDIGSDDVEIQMTDDGGAEIDFDPTAMAAQAAMQHDANLAEFLEDDILGEISSNLEENYDEYTGRS